MKKEQNFYLKNFDLTFFIKIINIGVILLNIMVCIRVKFYIDS